MLVKSSPWIWSRYLKQDKWIQSGTEVTGGKGRFSVSNVREFRRKKKEAIRRQTTHTKKSLT